MRIHHHLTTGLLQKKDLRLKRIRKFGKKPGWLVLLTLRLGATVLCYKVDETELTNIATIFSSTIADTRSSATVEVSRDALSEVWELESFQITKVTFKVI